MKNYYYDPELPLRPYTSNSDAHNDTLPPDNALRIEPIFKGGYWPCESKGQWVQVEDHRGKIAYSTQYTGLTEEVKNVGEISENYTLDSPPSHFAEWNNGWVESLELHKDSLLGRVDEEHKKHLEIEFDGTSFNVNLRDTIRSKLADADDLGDESINLQVGMVWITLSIDKAKILRTALAKKAKNLDEASKSHAEKIASLNRVLDAKKYKVDVGWPE